MDNILFALIARGTTVLAEARCWLLHFCNDHLTGCRITRS